MAAQFHKEILMHVVKTLPAAPQILARLGQLRLEPNSDLADVTKLLRCDAALTARIIRIANSPAYTVGEPYASIEQALARVGFAEIYKIAGFAAVAQMANQNLRLYNITGPQLRENSLLTALVMEALAGPAGADAHEAYSAGLLRSTGKIGLEGLMRDATSKASFEGMISGRLVEWETGLAGLSNCEAAAFILNEWRFPAGIVSAIGHHYVPEKGPAGPSLAHLLNLAAAASDRMGYGLPGEQAYWTLGLERMIVAGVTSQQVEDASRRAFEQFGRLRLSLA
jgi:HD-like signal output (HDOD) protein